ncbi:MAG: glutathione peroxidase [Bacteroidetes bacterium]|nr:glutathione peroxidase [Bacteroidota bacterium]
MKTIIYTLILISMTTLLNAQNASSFYLLKASTINHEDFDFSTLKGKKVLIVNTASKCGFTPQYKELQELYEKYGKDDFVILGFPSNDFASQEPGNEEQIKAFCQRNYGVTFPMMSKISVKGSDKHEVYTWLTDKDRNGKMDSKVNWNFQKYLVDEKGQLVEVYPSNVKPLDDRIVDWIKG